jgi:hypothetical protein
MTGNTIPLLHIFFLISVFSTVAKKKNDIQRTRIGAGDSRISVHQRFVERNGKIFLISFHEEKKKKKECQ